MYISGKPSQTKRVKYVDPPVENSNLLAPIISYREEHLLEKFAVFIRYKHGDASVGSTYQYAGTSQIKRPSVDDPLHYLKAYASMF